MVIMGDIMVEIGFTGSRNGCTDKQVETITRLLLWLDPTKVHHGDCVGADERFHNLVRELLPSTAIIIHPPSNDTMRAYCKGDNIRPPAPYIERNHNIVDETTILIATPAQSNEVLRSGTWATIRYARKRFKTLYVIPPEGISHCWI